MFTRNCQKFPTDASWPLKPLQLPLFTATQGPNPTLARRDEGGRATLRNARLTRRYRTASYEPVTSLELALYAQLSGRVH